MRAARLRRHVAERLGKLPGAKADAKPLSLDDAQLLIAGSEGPDGWSALWNSRCVTMSYG